jgi:hypothetical protein
LTPATVSKTDDAFYSNIQFGFPQQCDPGSAAHIEVIREWIRDCDTHQCLHSHDEPFLPTRLLDVGEQGSNHSRLLEDTTALNKDTKYLTLSHRWGSPPKPGKPDPLAGKIVCTYKHNIGRLKKSIDDAKLPPKYQDAVTIARKLNIQYLWIDSLCIIQRDRNDPNDKGEDWEDESKLMEQVFRSAYATIAASCAASPAEHFLKKRPERQCVTMERNKAFYYVCDVIDDFYGDVELGELNKRGWVFQERALSRRTVYFTETQTYWECGEGVRCETLTKTKKYVITKRIERCCYCTDLLSYSPRASLLGDANFPYSSVHLAEAMKIKHCQDLNQRYSKLALTYNTDRPIAIRGLETRLRRALNTDGGYGVFDVYLRRGLLWKRRQTRLERIPFPNERKDEANVHEFVPSWSWMASAGEIEYMDIPFEGVDWDQWDQDIVSPWKNVRDGNLASFELHVLARNIADPQPAGARIFLDDPSRSYGQPFKCVIVGSSKASNQGGSETYYVLIVAPLLPGENHVYERAGVAFLHKRQILWDNAETKARIR